MWRNYLDWVLAPATALIVAAFTYNGPLWLAWAAFGAVLFTFVEYWTHRILLHRWFWHGTHERHHTHPQEFSIFPVWYTPAIFAGFFVVLPAPIFAGFIVGYCWFLVWHHALHQWQLDRHLWVRRYADWHNQHHHGLPCNYGITTTLWDVVFRTYKAAR